MRLYFPDMMASISKKEVKRLDAADLTVKPSKPSVTRVEAPPEPSRELAEKTIDEAEKLYESRDLQRAGEVFRKALTQTDKHPIHARSYYGLARIAALQRNPELAEQLFRKTLELSPDPHTHAWSEVFLGRLAQASAAPQDADGGTTKRRLACRTSKKPGKPLKNG